MVSHAKVYAADFEEGVRLSFAHAIQLLEGAELLEADKKHSSAKFLALHAREELGRALLLLDDISAGKPWVSVKRWDSKLTDHKHKLRRFHLAVTRATGYKEGPVTISLGEPKLVKYIPEGEVIKNFAQYDMEKRDRSLYVDYDAVGGIRQWISPRNPVGFSKEARVDINYSQFGVHVVRELAKQNGISL